MNLTIIIPHYNSPKLLKRLLTSIPKRDDFQIIVVDDNSTVQLEVLEKVILEDARCEFYKNDRGVQSAGACRNIGLEHVEGKWLLFADADDYFITGFEKIIEDYFNCDVDIVFFMPTSVFEDTKEIGDRYKNAALLVSDYLCNISESSTLIEDRLKYKTTTPWGKLIRTSVVLKNKIRFDETIVSNDVMFCMKIGFAALKITADKNIIYCTTQSKGTLTTLISEPKFDVRVDIFIRRAVFLKENLSANMYKYIKPAALLYIITTLNFFGIKKGLEVYRSFRKNGVSLIGYIDLKSLSLFKLIRRSINFIKRQQYIELEAKDKSSHVE